MEHILNILIPIFLLILMGYYFKRIKFPSDDFWVGADKFNYYVLFPSLLFYKLSTAKLDSINGDTFLSTAFLCLLLITLFLMVLNKIFFHFQGSSFTSVYQGAIRFNTYVFLALTDSLFADEGIIIAAFLITVLIPIINVFCISIFSIYVSNGKISISSFLKSIIKNPLILACILGGSFNYFDLSLSLFLENTISILSKAALPLGLLSVGVGLQLSFLKETKFKLFVSSFIKLFVYPCLMFFMGKSLGVKGDFLSILVLFAAMPTASSSYALARQLGGDLKLMSAIITFQTIVSIFSISFILSLII